MTATAALVGLLAFALAVASNWLETLYVRAVHAFELAEGAARVSASRRITAYDVTLWCVSVVALYACVAFGWWLLVPEGLGVVVGSRMGLAGRV